MVGILPRLLFKAILASASNVSLVNKANSVALEAEEIKYLTIPWGLIAIEVITPKDETVSGSSSIDKSSGAAAASITSPIIFKVEVALIVLFITTVITTNPLLIGVTSPLLSTLAIRGLELIHLISLMAALLGSKIGFNWTFCSLNTSDATISSLTPLATTKKGTTLIG